MKYINAHCHEFIKTPHVIGAIVNSTRESEWNTTIRLQSSNVRVALGVHPWYVGDITDNWQQRLMDTLGHNPNAMVGETGLDTTRENINLQQDIFISHLRIAHQLNRGINVHCVHAWDRLLHIFKTWHLPPVILLHGFAGTPEIINQMPDNVYYSFGHDILNSVKAIGRIKAVPDSRVLVESDDFSPGILPDLVKKIAEIKQIDNVKMADIILNNTQRFLNNGQVK